MLQKNQVYPVNQKQKKAKTQMKRHHAYYCLRRDEPPIHRFAVYCSLSLDLVQFATWDGTSSDIVSRGGAFGIPHGLPNEQAPLPNQILHLVKPLEQLFKTRMQEGGVGWLAEKEYQILIFYEGFVSLMNVECFIILNETEYSKKEIKNYTAGCNSKGRWGPWMDNPFFTQCYHEEITLVIDVNTGSAKLASSAWSMCSDSGHCSSYPAPTKVFDFVSTIPTVDSEGQFLKDNYYMKLEDNWRDSPLLGAILENRVLDLQQYHERYNIVPNVSLDIFRPSRKEWQEAIETLSVDERRLANLLKNPELFCSDPQSWWGKAGSAQVGIARAFLISNPVISKLLNRFLTFDCKYYPNPWEALKALDHEFPYPVYQAEEQEFNKLPPALIANQSPPDPPKYRWIVTNSNAWIVDLYRANVPKEDWGNLCF